MDGNKDPSALLLAQVENFLLTHGMSARKFGTLAANDPSLVHELRKGRELFRHTRARVFEFMAAHSSVSDHQGTDTDPQEIGQQKDSNEQSKHVPPFHGRVLP